MSLLYEAHLQRHGWGLTRPPAYWEWAAGWLNREICLVCEGDNGLEGYLVAEITPRLQLPDEYVFRRTDDPLWPVDIGPVLHIVEMVAATPTARHALGGYLARRSQEAATLAYPLACRSDLESCGFFVPPARVRLMPSFMFRVINVAEAVRALVDLPAPDEPFSLVVSDPVGLNSEPLAIFPGGGRPEVVAGRREKHHLEMDIQAFSQMYAGYRSANSLWALGRLRASSERAVDLADQVFIHREPFIGELDLF
jgi:predicted acetyltransferase